MVKVSDVMTRSLATVSPDATVAEVADMMRERNIGSVLVMADNKLRGIVTDRDLVTCALSGKGDARQTPVGTCMTTRVIVGNASWDLTKASRTMARHQIRRLPIYEGSRLAGIISLGDIALYENRDDVVANSLEAISKPSGIALPHRARIPGALVAGVALAALAGTTFAFVTRTQQGRALRKEVTNRFNASRKSAEHAVRTAGKRVKFAEKTSARSLNRFLDRAHNFIEELAA